MIPFGRSIFLFSFVFTCNAAAQSISICGDAPPVANELLKGEIKGKAQLLTRYFGESELSGKIETSRTEIFSRYPEAEKSRSNAYFEYQVCVLIMGDNTKTPTQKLDALKEIKREFGKPAVQKFETVFRAGSRFIDNRRFGPVDGSISTLHFKVDGKLVTKYELDKPFGSYRLQLAAGDHSFEFIGKIYGSGSNAAILEDNCQGVFTVNQSGVFQPKINIEQRELDGSIRSCSLDPI